MRHQVSPFRTIGETRDSHPFKTRLLNSLSHCTALSIVTSEKQGHVAENNEEDWGAEGTPAPEHTPVGVRSQAGLLEGIRPTEVRMAYSGRVQ